MHRVGAADGVDPGLGQADVPDLALLHQPRERAHGVLDGGARVDAVLVVQVDAVGAEAPQRALDGGTDVGRAAVQARLHPAVVGDEAELGGQHHLVAAALQGPADELLVDVRAVDLRGVDQRDPELDRPVDGADRLGVVAAGAAVAVRHSHRTESDAGDLEFAEFGGTHGVSFRSYIRLLGSGGRRSPS
ncbi:hypothetical protein GCM10027610_041080 [Dactylosporangium cerinum]